MKQGNVAASSSITSELDYIPQFIGVKFGATGNLSRITVTSDSGDVILNLNEAGFKALAQSYSIALLDAITSVFLVPLGSGQLGVSCTVFIQADSGVGGVDWYTTSKVGIEKDLPITIKSVLMNVKANANSPLSGFMKLIILAMGGSDVCTLMSSSRFGGVSTQMFKEEFVALACHDFNNAGGDVVIDNSDQSVSSVNLNPTAERTVVIHQLAVGGASTPNGMLANLVSYGENGAVLARSVGGGGDVAPVASRDGRKGVGSVISTAASGLSGRGNSVRGGMLSGLFNRNS